MHKLLWATARVLVLVAVLAMLGLSALLFTARAIVRPAPGDWVTTLRVGPLKMEVGMTALVQWGSTPWIARKLNGRKLSTQLGDVRLAWDDTNQQLSLTCQPCALRSSSWGGEPLRLQGAYMTMRRNDTMLHGTLHSGSVSATWKGMLRPNGITLHIDLPNTQVAEGYALFVNAIPELARAQIEGTFALNATLDIPSKKLSVRPRLDGMRVQGLGTQTWAQAQTPCSLGLPADMAKVALRSDSLLARAVLAAEDQRFYEHPGFDLVEMSEALRSNQAEDETQQSAERAARPPRGASTLSQQVAKLLVTGGERSPVRKLRELLYAVEMEETLGKARILRLYLENAPWGVTACGAQAAAYTYFQQRADQLSPAQAVWLAAMLHNPVAEVRHWRGTGQINQARAQWVASNMRPMRKAQRSRLSDEIATASWDPVAMGQD